MSFPLLVPIGTSLATIFNRSDKLPVDKNDRVSFERGRPLWYQEQKKKKNHYQSNR